MGHEADGDLEHIPCGFRAVGAVHPGGGCVESSEHLPSMGLHRRWRGDFLVDTNDGKRGNGYKLVKGKYSSDSRNVSL